LRDYRLPKNRLKAKLDICIVTYNRLEYLKKCIWSIIASTSCQYRIFVIDDHSPLDTQEWLISMQERRLIHTIILNDKNLGTATNFNKIIDASDSDWFVMANDDMYFYRYWDCACLDIINHYKDCGLVSFYNYTRYNLDPGVEKLNHVLRVPRTGMGATLVLRDLYEQAGKFNLPKHKIMGFFASKFCQAASKVALGRNRHYATVPHYAAHMDLNDSKLCERKYQKDYIAHRQEHKR